MAPKALPKKNELADMTVKDLKTLCQKRDINQGGSKDELIKKLLNFQKAADKAAALKAAAKDNIKANSSKAVSAASVMVAAQIPPKDPVAASIGGTPTPAVEAPMTKENSPSISPALPTASPANAASALDTAVAGSPVVGTAETPSAIQPNTETISSTTTALPTTAASAAGSPVADTSEMPSATQPTSATPTASTGSSPTSHSLPAASPAKATSVLGAAVAGSPVLGKAEAPSAIQSLAETISSSTTPSPTAATSVASSEVEDTSGMLPATQPTAATPTAMCSTLTGSSLPTASPAKISSVIEEAPAATSLPMVSGSPAKRLSAAPVDTHMNNKAVRISPNVLVTLRDLSKTEMNGKRAEAKQWLKEKGRWQCRLIGSDDVLNLRPRNLVPEECPASLEFEEEWGCLNEDELEDELLDGQCVVLKGIASKPELNGERAEVLEWVEEKERWLCHLISRDEQVNLRPVNLAWDRPSAESPEAKRRRLQCCGGA